MHPVGRFPTTSVSSVPSSVSSAPQIVRRKATGTHDSDTVRAYSSGAPVQDRNEPEAFDLRTESLEAADRYVQQHNEPNAFLDGLERRHAVPRLNRVDDILSTSRRLDQDQEQFERSGGFPNLHASPISHRGSSHNPNFISFLTSPPSPRGGHVTERNAPPSRSNQEQADLDNEREFNQLFNANSDFWDVHDPTAQSSDSDSVRSTGSASYYSPDKTRRVPEPPALSSRKPSNAESGRASRRLSLADKPSPDDDARPPDPYANLEREDDGAEYPAHNFDPQEQEPHAPQVRKAATKRTYSSFRAPTAASAPAGFFDIRPTYHMGTKFKLKTKKRKKRKKHKACGQCT